MHKHIGRLKSQKQMRAWLACGVFVLAFFMCLSCFSPKASADGEDATSYFTVKTCVKVRKDNGNYGTLKSVLGSSGIKRYWPIKIKKDNQGKEYGEATEITENKDESSVYIDVNNDCIETKTAHWPGDMSTYGGSYTINIYESELENISGENKKLDFLFTSTINWKPKDGVTWAAVDFRNIDEKSNLNTIRDNVVIGFCKYNYPNCPIAIGMYGTMDDGKKAITILNPEKSSYTTEEPRDVSTFSGSEHQLVFGTTINYAVFNTIPEGGNLITINRCNKNGKQCGVSSNNRASADGIIDIHYYSDTRKSFEGRGRINAGTKVDDTNSTGYTQTDGTTKNIKIKCSNVDGCKVSWDLYLKRAAGSGATAYQIGTSRNGGTISYIPATNIAPLAFNDETKVVNSGTSTLKPGESECHYVRFKPYGNYDGEKFIVVGVCAEAKPVTFSGYSKVSFGKDKSASTGWKNTGKVTDTAENTAWLALDNCNDGCTVTWNHGIKQGDNNLSSATTNYKITTRGEGEGVFPTTSPKDHSEKIYTGQIMCRDLEIDSEYFYNTDGNLNTNKSSTRACVYAIGTTGSAIDIKVKKSSSTSWVDAPDSNPIWAKPTDVIDLKGEYTPKYQRAYSYTKPYTVNIEKTGASTISTINKSYSKTIQQLFNDNINPDWNNAFSIKLTGNKASFDQAEKTNAIGDANAYSLQKTYTVGSNDTGRSITATALTNDTNSTKTTPKSIKFTYSVVKPGEVAGKNLVATINYDSISDNAYIKVPYNFENKTEVKTDDKNIIYAGESKKFDILINTNPRTNNVTNGNYATRVDGAKWKLELCYEGECGWFNANAGSGTLNANSNAEGAQVKKSITVGIPDVKAGTEVCVRSAVYPVNSHDDKNLLIDAYPPNDEMSWAYSKRVCFIVAKRPSLQIWGGNVYSHGKITTGTSIKNNLAGITNYNVSVKNNENYVFGSWGELGIIANDTVVGLASGAATGLPLGNLERTNDTSFCHRSPLSFANTKCKEGVVGGGASSSIASAEKDKQAIIDRFFTSGEPNISDGAIALNEASENYYHSSRDLTIETSTVYKGATKVIHSDKNITINGNIYYDSNGSMFLNDIPKLVIYAENIIINCDVTNIDAILVANQNVKTCQSDDINSQDNSKPLTINGAVISDSLTPNRTYGAATGINSVIPAEIINFDPTLYLWGGSKADDDNTILLDTTYIREVSPRY